MTTLWNISLREQKGVYKVSEPVTHLIWISDWLDPDTYSTMVCANMYFRYPSDDVRIFAGIVLRVSAVHLHTAIL